MLHMRMKNAGERVFVRQLYQNCTMTNYKRRWNTDTELLTTAQYSHIKKSAHDEADPPTQPQSEQKYSSVPAASITLFCKILAGYG